MRSLPIPLALALQAIWCAALASQEAPPPVFGEIVEVRVVNIEVVVEDAQGERVRDLPASAFRLKVDGAELPVDYFTEVVDGRTTALGRNPAADRQPRSVGTSYLLLLDEYFGVRLDLDQVLDGIAGTVGRLGPRDRMAIVAFDGRKLDLLKSWNQDPLEIQRVLEQARDRPAQGLMTAKLVDQIGLVSEAESRLDRIVAAALSTMRSFANPPGRKVMLLAAGGWPDLVGTELLDPVYRFDYQRGSRSLERLYETANLLGYTVYPIDASRRGNQVGTDASGARSTSGVVESDYDFLRGTLDLLADATGGELIPRSARHSTLDRVIDDTRTYYWLGFTPDWKGDDANHEIEVEVLRPGLRARHRAGYQDMSSAREVDLMVESALMVGHVAGSEPLEVVVGEPRRKRRRIHLPLEVTIPLDAVTVLPVAGQYVTQVELRLAAVDERGNRSEVDRIPITLRGSNPPDAGQLGRQAVTAVVRPSTQSVVVSVHDRPSGTILASVIDLRPRP